MKNDNTAIAAWAERKKQRKAEQQAREKALQKLFTADKFPPLDFSSLEPLPEPVPEAPSGDLAPPATIKGLAFDSARGKYRARAYKNNRQVNLYWGPSLAKALEALEEWRATGINPNT